MAMTSKKTSPTESQLDLMIDQFAGLQQSIERLTRQMEDRRVEILSHLEMSGRIRDFEGKFEHVTKEGTPLKVTGGCRVSVAKEAEDILYEIGGPDLVRKASVPVISKDKIDSLIAEEEIPEDAAKSLLKSSRYWSVSVKKSRSSAYDGE